jgi:cation transporter-like permease
VPASLRKVLIDSHVAAVAIAVLIFFSAESVTRAVFVLKDPAFRLVYWLIEAVAIRDIPYIPRTLDPNTFLMLLCSISYFLFAMTQIAAAWLLSRWVYGTGPLRVLGNYRGILLRKIHA